MAGSSAHAPSDASAHCASAKRGGGVRDLHARADSWRVFECAQGVAIVALWIERLARDLSDLARACAAHPRRHEDGEKVECGRDQRADDEEPQPEHFAPSTHHVDAAQERRQVGENEGQHARRLLRTFIPIAKQNSSLLGLFREH